MHPNHKFEEEPFAQTSSTSFVGGQLSNSESFDPMFDVQSQINNFIPLPAQVAANTSAISTLNTQVSGLKTTLNTASASFQLAYVGGLPLTQDALGTIPLYVWSHT